jgi:hypothetical protein
MFMNSEFGPQIIFLKYHICFNIIFEGMGLYEIVNLEWKVNVC